MRPVWVAVLTHHVRTSNLIGCSILEGAQLCSYTSLSCITLTKSRFISDILLAIDIMTHLLAGQITTLVRIYHLFRSQKMDSTGPFVLD